MAQYKVPQDVEAEDKLLGPFSFRQLIYLFIAGGLVALAFGLFQLVEFLAVIPIPFAIFFVILALPLRKDQPMEVYLAALVSFYLKPNKRFWNPGQRESTIKITAPKKLEGPRVRNLSEDEATNRLSFLADVIDSEGQSITGNWNRAIKDEYLAEASSTQDMFETYSSQNLGTRINNETATKHAEAIEQMRAAINKAENIDSSTPPTISRHYSAPSGPSAFTVTATTPTPTTPIVQPITFQPPAPTPPPPENPAKTAAMQQLASNPDYTVATIAKEAKRIKEDNDNEVYISLH